MNAVNRNISGGMITAAVCLWVTWTIATYALEGYPGTLLRPEAVGMRLAYALVANVMIGIAGAGTVVFFLSRTRAVALERWGFRDARRIFIGIALGALLGTFAFLSQRPVSSAPVVIGNVFAQVWVVSLAEVVVCWVVLGTVVQIAFSTGQRRWLGSTTSVALVAVAFGVYHLAHSPPFNTLRMVAIMTMVGVATGVFFSTLGEIYGTVVFHNFLALKGVTDALDRQGALDRYATLQPPLIGTAVVATGALVAVHLFLRRRSGVSS